MRLTIKLKLALAFGLIVSLLIGIGLVSVSKLATVNATLDDIVNHHTTQVVRAEEMRVNLLQSVRYEKNAILALSQADTDKFADEALQERAEAQRRAGLLASEADERGRQILTQISAATDHLAAVQDQTLHDAKLNSSNLAITALGSEEAPAWTAVTTDLDGMVQQTEQHGGADRPTTLLASEKLRGAMLNLRVLLEAAVLAPDADSVHRATAAVRTAAQALHREADTLLHALPAAASIDTVAFSSNFDAWTKKVDSITTVNDGAGIVTATDRTMGEGRAAATAAITAIEDFVKYTRGRMSDAQAAAAASYQQSRLLLLSTLAVSLFAAVAAAGWMAYSISRGLRRAIGLADAVALGDLSQTVTVTSRDEVRDMIDALNRMTTNLRATAQVADAISEGDLTVVAKPLSDRDTLGLSLNRMTVSTISKVA